MKRFLTCALSIALSSGMALSNVSAAGYNTKKIDSAITAVSKYYQKNNTLTSSDDVIAAGALGLNLSKKFKLDNDYKKSLTQLTGKDSTLGNLSKGIIALVLLGENPAAYNNQNYVKALEGYVQKDGSVRTSLGSNQDVYVLFALTAVHSPKAKAVADYLSKEALDNGAYWYEYNGVKTADDATTAWAAEALDVTDAKAYKSTVNKALAYLKTGLKADGSYDTSGFGGNADTQACVLEALFTNNKKAVLNSSNKVNPIDYLLGWQQKDGSFGALDYTTNKVASNPYTTDEAARSLGTYQYGSVYEVAAQKYQDAYLSKAISSVKLSKTSYVYNGKKQAPKVTVQYGKKTLKANKDYTVTYAKGSKKIGQYQVKVAGKGLYTGKFTKNYTIKPAKVTGLKATATKKALNVQFNKVPGKVNYQVAYKISNAKKYSYVKTAKNAVKVAHLKSGKTYVVKARAYKKAVNGAYSSSVKVNVR